MQNCSIHSLLKHDWSQVLGVASTGSLIICFLLLLLSLHFAISSVLYLTLQVKDKKTLLFLSSSRFTLSHECLVFASDVLLLSILGINYLLLETLDAILQMLYLLILVLDVDLLF